jgi:hypothetical protein
MNLGKIIGVLALLGVVGALAACTQEEVDANMAKAKTMASQVVEVAKAVCDVTPKAAALATAVMGMEPTTVAIATVATTVCVWVKTPNTMAAAFDPCPGGLLINNVCVPVEKE